MRFIVGQKFTIIIAGQRRQCDMHIIGIDDYGQFHFNYKYHGLAYSEDNQVSYSADVMNGYIKNKQWKIVSNTIPNMLDEDLFTL